MKTTNLPVHPNGTSDPNYPNDGRPAKHSRRLTRAFAIPFTRLPGGIFLVIVLDLLHARITEEELVAEAAYEAEGDALDNRDDEAT